MAIGWKNIAASWYYFQGNGSMAAGWVNTMISGIISILIMASWNQTHLSSMETVGTI